jgi:hypothetical protein
MFSRIRELFFFTFFGGILNLRRLVSWQACTEGVGVE